MSETVVGIINIFEGPLHTRLRNIWRATEASQNERWGPTWKIRWFENPQGLPHGAMLQRMWEALRNTTARYVVLTEHDFLPGPFFPGTSRFSLALPETAIMAAEYCTRDPDSYKLTAHNLPGPWWVCIDKQRLGRRVLDFTAGGQFNDPCAKLPRPFLSIVPSDDAMPRHYGIDVRGKIGTHLFWSRHYNDNQWQTVAGFPLWDVMGRVRSAVDRYIGEMPADAKAAFEELSQTGGNAAGPRPTPAPDADLEATEAPGV